MTLFSYVSLALHIHVPSDTDKSQGTELVHQTAPLPHVLGSQLNTSPSQGLQPTTLSGIASVEAVKYLGISCKSLIKPVIQSSHHWDLTSWECTCLSYLGINKQSFPLWCFLPERENKFILRMYSKHPNLSVSSSPNTQEFGFLFILYWDWQKGRIHLIFSW